MPSRGAATGGCIVLSWELVEGLQVMQERLLNEVTFLDTRSPDVLLHQLARRLRDTG